MKYFKNKARNLVAIAALISFMNHTAYAAQSIWGAAHVAPAAASMRLPVDTSSSSSPGQLNLGDIGTLLTGSAIAATGSISDGKILIGNTSTGGLALSTLTQGTGVTIANSAGGITISATGASPLTTKGDIFAYSTTNGRFPVGADGTILQADSSQTFGVKWATLAGGGNVTGPVSSTANAIAKYFDTGGVTLINSGVIIDSSNNITGVGTLASGAHTITSASASALTVGLNGATNPVLKVDASTSVQADGISITGAGSGSGTTIASISASSNSPLNVTSKGSGALNLKTTSATTSIVIAPGGTGRFAINSSVVNFTPTTNTTASTVRFSWVGAADGGMDAATEAPSVYFNAGQTRQWLSNTAVTLQRGVRFTGSTYAFVSSGGVVTDAATVAIDGAPSAGTNATLTNAHGLYIPTIAVGGTVTNAYGLSVAAPSGATSNWAQKITGATVRAGTADSIAAGTGAGTGPTLAVAGTPLQGEITLTTGATPAGTNAIIATITYANACPTDSTVQLTPVNANAGGLAAALTEPYPTGTTTDFKLNSGTTGLSGATQYIWNYAVSCY